MDPNQLVSATFWSERAPWVAGGGLDALPDAGGLLEGHVLFATSGSGGIPKWVVLAKDALLVSADAINRHLEVTRGSCWGLVLPAHHVGGFGVAARAYAAGCTMSQFGHRWQPAAACKWLADARVSHTSLVPAQVHDLVAAGLRAPHSLQAVIVGGGHLAAATGQAARALGWPMLATYGMTECASQIATQALASLTAIYQPAPIPVLPIWQVATDDHDRLRVAGPALFSGYVVRDVGSWVYQPRQSEWHQTADRVALGAGGLTPLGRADHQVKVLGELVDLDAIEQELAALASGRLAPGSFAVVAVPDARAEHALVPVFDAGVTLELIDEVLAMYARHAPGLRRLQPAVQLQDFPRSPLGKPRRSQIASAVAHTRP